MNGLDGRQWTPPPRPPQKPSFTARDAGCVFMVLGVLAAILFPVFAVSHSGSGPSCLSHLKLVNLGSLQYAQDCDDRLPQAKWMDATYPYVKNWPTYACPVAHSEDESSYGYGMERALLGAATTKVKEPSKQPMTFDSRLLYKNAAAAIRIGLDRPGRHSKGSNIGFLDGHAKWWSDSSAAAFRWRDL